MKLTVESYRNWRRNFWIFVVVYLAADLTRHGFKNSTLNALCYNGLLNYKVFENTLSNTTSTAFNVVKFSLKGVAGAVVGIGKVCNRLLFGAAKNSESKQQEEPQVTH